MLERSFNIAYDNQIQSLNAHFLLSSYSYFWCIFTSTSEMESSQISVKGQVQQNWAYIVWF